MTTIGFVRHGVTAWNKEGRKQGNTDIPLDHEGIDMAKRIANRIVDDHWDVIYTSPLIRAKRTAEIIAEKNAGIPILVDCRLVENGGGMIEGTTEEERIAKWGKAWSTLELGLEQEADSVSRGMSFINHVKHVHPGKRVLVVSHGDFIVGLIHALVPNSKFPKSIGNTSVTIIDLQDEENVCQLFNCMKHLDVEEVSC